MDLVYHNPHSISVRDTDTLQAAFDKMVDNKEDVIPVLDKDGKIIGDLTLNGVLSTLKIDKQQYRTEIIKEETGYQDGAIKRQISARSDYQGLENNPAICLESS
jgi:predicted transcriptional regulator